MTSILAKLRRFDRCDEGTTAVEYAVALGLILRSRATSGVPGKFQLLWEMVVGAVQRQVAARTATKIANVAAAHQTLNATRTPSVRLRVLIIIA